MSVDLCHVKLTWTDPLGKKKCSNKHEYCNYISVSCLFYTLQQHHENGEKEKAQFVHVTFHSRGIVVYMETWTTLLDHLVKTFHT